MTISTGLAVVIVLLVVCLVISSTALGLTINSKTNIANERSVQNKPMVSVERNNIGNFATTMISLDGIAVNPKDAATKEYVDSTSNFHPVVNNDPTSTNGHLAVFKGDTSKVIQDSNLNATSVVTNPATLSTTDAIVTFTGTGIAVQSGTKSIDGLVPYVDATGNVDMNSFTVNCKYQQVPKLGKLSMTTAGPSLTFPLGWQPMFGSFVGNLLFPPNSVTNSATLRIRFTFFSTAGDFGFRLVNKSTSNVITSWDNITNIDFGGFFLVCNN